ncbi:RNA polymerase sigma-70 factor (ECF subfamily) [Xanthomonas arboricola]|uniref:RNA polymerase sigma factor n=1 Tax=Xanthomonas arboricola TaxID=56448 RepID=UPI0014310F41|nr:sigma-70 family RNA polymerase sigma factor [Xanthomonas arboricola]MBB6335866.1 RNA polymerase sigma-70 factor (ECF subfamily) [Xanthomonas arboricola]NJC32454.1 RNA polymerase sigma-70 factor (ECF subfamily) [Xanthomonas arboricola]
MPAIDSQRAAWLATQILPHEPALRRWLRKHAPGNVDCDDVIQETYAILAGLGEVGHIANPRAYLFTAAQSVLLQQVRRARIVSIESVAEIERLDITQDERSPERHAIAGQELRRIGEALAALPDKCRQVFLLRKVDGLSQREIAARLGISENTVEKHIVKGLRLLMARMGRTPAPAQTASQAAPARRLADPQRGS